jgi:hypothetical protein
MECHHWISVWAWADTVKALAKAMAASFNFINNSLGESGSA